MGKRAEDLPLNNQPIRPQDPIDPRDTDWYRLLQQIDDMLSMGSYTWAEATLSDIRETVERAQAVTEGQQRAVDNIERARTSRANRSRRGEGFGGRRW